MDEDVLKILFELISMGTMVTPSENIKIPCRRGLVLSWNQSVSSYHTSGFLRRMPQTNSPIDGIVQLLVKSLRRIFFGLVGNGHGSTTACVRNSYDQVNSKKKGKGGWEKQYPGRHDALLGLLTWSSWVYGVGDIRQNGGIPHLHASWSSDLLRHP